ncbi:MAG: hypothetical protein A3H51_00260 [Candidatus Spechtbacteria bacterium RIFCSPLOWO2_02_FULL_38_8]|uniref:Uncharacterized protein n=1 Tax=Candidatus Spechtbacteria bacterium RIFCSPLOWO2_02_FULL_38_8 TaxID=1802164 RepID=A0A1G2HH43_9BACT|nr:MAG: hypothetical protein A3H51_00260 [Candidatus Spechtbacteria bacterium RIFCSPLOWO2_02_FULL_38_8]
MNKNFTLLWVLIAVIVLAFVWYFNFDSDYSIKQQELTKGDEIENIEQDLETLEQDLGDLDAELSDLEQDLSNLEAEI